MTFDPEQETAPSQALASPRQGRSTLWHSEAKGRCSISKSAQLERSKSRQRRKRGK
jgi:hypothetical protein